MAASSEQPVGGADLPFEISVETLAAMRNEGTPHHLLDVREPWELDLCRIDGSLAIPLDELRDRLAEVPGDAPVIVVCHHGQRSAHATHWLRGAGRAQAVNLAGGIDAWARRIDAAVRIY
jgi:rhodanese-related sulfurtransferase